jgi:electron transport complex protein RnfG
MKKIIKDALILFAITLVSGVILGIVYDMTKEPIAAQELKTKQEAYQKVLPDAEKFESLKDDKYTNQSIQASDDTDFSKDAITEIVAGVKNNKIVGFVITVTAADGYGGKITFTCGLDKDGKYVDTSILSINETAGLGMRVKSDPSFLNQFKGVTTDKFNLVKDGTGTSADDKIDAIGGSTITSKAMTKGINAAVVTAKKLVSDKVTTEGGATIE